MRRGDSHKLAAPHSSSFQGPASPGGLAGAHQDARGALAMAGAVRVRVGNTPPATLIAQATDWPWSPPPPPPQPLRNATRSAQALALAAGAPETTCSGTHHARAVVGPSALRLTSRVDAGGFDSSDSDDRSCGTVMVRACVGIGCGGNRYHWSLHSLLCHFKLDPDPDPCRARACCRSRDPDTMRQCVQGPQSPRGLAHG